MCLFGHFGPTLHITSFFVFIVSVRFRKLRRREWKVKRHFKSLQKCHSCDSFEDRKKNKISNKNSNASPYPIFLSPNPHISYLLDPLSSSVFFHYWTKSSLKSLYSTKSSLNSNYTLEVDWNHCTWCRPYVVWSYHISDVV